MDDVINKVKVAGHKGPHPPEYHEAVFQRLVEATKGLEGKEYVKAFEKTLNILKKEVSTAGSYLNKLVPKTK